MISSRLEIMYLSNHLEACEQLSSMGNPIEACINHSVMDSEVMVSVR